MNAFKNARKEYLKREKKGRVKKVIFSITIGGMSLFIVV